MRRIALPLLGLCLLAFAASPTRAQRGASSRGGWLRAVATAYRAWGRVDDQLRWAPADCRMLMPSRARLSRASGEHARKVYFVYASDMRAYEATTERDEAPPRGLTVVKEAFTPRSLTEEERTAGTDGYRRPFPRIPGAPETTQGPILPSPNVYSPIVMPDGTHLGAGAPRGLYAMRYLGADVAGTDAGWIYGTITAGGTVTASGQVARCMRCHRGAPHGRLFGTPEDE